MLYVAAPCASLGVGCPIGTVLLGQAVMDRVSATADGADGWIPNILQQFGTEHNFTANGADAKQRYHFLRSLEDPRYGIFACNSLRVQWAGELEALQEFDRTSQHKLPHMIEGYLQLGETHPCHLKRLPGPGRLAC